MEKYEAAPSLIDTVDVKNATISAEIERLESASKRLDDLIFEVESMTEEYNL